MLFSLLLLLAARAAEAGSPLTIEEAAALAAEQAPAVTRALAETDRARARFSATRSRLGPSLTADLGFFGTDDPVGAFRLALQQERFSPSEFFASDPNHPSFTRDWNGAISAEWAVDLFGSVRGETRAAEKAVAAADRAANRTRDAAAFQAIDAFAAARRGEDALSILADRATDAAKDVEIANSLREQGMATPADPARASAALAEVRAEIAGFRGIVAQARAVLATLIGTAADRPLAALPPPRPIRAGDPSGRDDVIAANLSAAAARDRAKAAAAARWPSLLVSARYEVHSERPGGRSGDSGSVFGGVRVPIFTFGAIESRVREARAASLSADASALETRRSAEKDVLSARAALDAAEARVAAFGEAEAAARKAREIQQARYEEGAARLADLLEARGAELRARLGVSAAKSERAVAEATLRLALGLSPLGEEVP